MKKVLRALDRNEKVTVLYHGKEKGVIVPKTESNRQRVIEHSFFGLKSKSEKPVEDIMKDLRSNRY